MRRGRDDAPSGGTGSIEVLEAADVHEAQELVAPHMRDGEDIPVVQDAVLKHGHHLAPGRRSTQDVAQVVAHGGTRCRRAQVPQDAGESTQGLGHRVAGQHASRGGNHAQGGLLARRPHLAEHEPLVRVAPNDPLQPAHDALHDHRGIVTFLADDRGPDVSDIAVPVRIAHESRGDHG